MIESEIQSKTKEERGNEEYQKIEAKREQQTNETPTYPLKTKKNSKKISRAEIYIWTPQSTTHPSTDVEGGCILFTPGAASVFSPKSRFTSDVLFSSKLHKITIKYLKTFKTIEQTIF